MIILKKLAILIICVLISFSVFIFSLFKPIGVTALTQTKAKQTDKLVIIIDAGHGGFDGGAQTDDGFPEKDINLAISKQLDYYLNYFGYKTLLTRSDDSSLEDNESATIRRRKTSDLHNRMKLMEETESSIFISIHQNHFSQEKYSGMQVFYSPGFKSESSRLASCIQEVTVNKLQKDNTRKIKECGSSVFLIHNAVRPAVLVECGFLSNNRESELLKTEKYQKQIAFCIALGVHNYLSTR